MMNNIWENDDFIFDGHKLKGMTAKGKQKVKEQEFTDMVIPEKSPTGEIITVIGDNAFYRRKLTSVVIPDTVEYIGYDAFGVCNLEEIKLPSALIEIEGFAFYRNKLKKIEFGDKLKRIEPSAFALNKLTEINLPKSLESIEASAFYKNNLTKIELPESLKKLNMYAFCKNSISEVKIPKTLEKLHSKAFDETTEIK